MFLCDFDQSKPAEEVFPINLRKVSLLFKFLKLWEKQKLLKSGKWRSWSLATNLGLWLKLTIMGLVYHQLKAHLECLSLLFEYQFGFCPNRILPGFSVFRGSLPLTPLTPHPSTTCSSWGLNIWHSSCTAKLLSDFDWWNMLSSSANWGGNGCSSRDAVGGYGTENNNGTGGIGGTGIEKVGRTGFGDNLQRNLSV